jgi:hypothetical protein
LKHALRVLDVRAQGGKAIAQVGSHNMQTRAALVQCLRFTLRDRAAADDETAFAFYIERYRQEFHRVLPPIVEWRQIRPARRRRRRFLKAPHIGLDRARQLFQAQHVQKNAAPRNHGDG